MVLDVIDISVQSGGTSALRSATGSSLPLYTWKECKYPCLSVRRNNFILKQASLRGMYCLKIIRPL